MPNRLATETSPYLLQHANNPVDWYPWGDEAFALAKQLDKPVLLSIGYTACHWCHVMEHESFEDADTARYMNQHFVNVKVDREERPDIDHIYMSAVQALTGQGGWPMTVFLTPDQAPFYAGTYFPPKPRFGMPSFAQVLTGLVDAWQKKRADILKNAGDIAGHIHRIVKFNSQGHVLDPLLFDRAIEKYESSFDAKHGGFGKAPKFPPSMALGFLLRIVWQTNSESARRMATHTLNKMAAGGMYDHLGGGFARYSTDNRWLVPHFEKMLYDNGQLVRAYVDAYRLTRHANYRVVALDSVDWVLREMTDESGGFYSSQDADSEGVEGKFYVWQKAEVEAVLGDGAALFCDFYDVTKKGNWEHANVLNTPKNSADIAQKHGLKLAELDRLLTNAREKLYQHRSQRIWPATDDKILTSWNGLMLGAIAETGRCFKRTDYLEAAVKNAEFLYENLRRPNGRLHRTWKAGSTGKLNGYLEDYAYLADGLLALYQAVFDPKWYLWAKELADLMLEHFFDSENGGFFDTSDDHENLLFRPKNIQDNAVPSPGAMACRVLIQLSLLSGEGRYADIAEETVSAMYPMMAQYPTGFSHWLGSAWLLLSEPKEIAIIGDVTAPATQTFLRQIDSEFRPNLVVAAGDSGTIPLLQDRPQVDSQPTAYVCQNFVCQRPTTDLNVFKEQLTKN